VSVWVCTTRGSPHRSVRSRRPRRPPVCAAEIVFRGSTLTETHQDRVAGAIHGLIALQDEDRGEAAARRTHGASGIGDTEGLRPGIALGRRKHDGVIVDASERLAWPALGLAIDADARRIGDAVDLGLDRLTANRA
jgi:hypothetical protein